MTPETSRGIRDIARRIAAAAPPLTPLQRSRLAAVLHPDLATETIPTSRQKEAAA
jgi:hypothetical protein